MFPFLDFPQMLTKCR